MIVLLVEGWACEKWEDLQQKKYYPHETYHLTGAAVTVTLCCGYKGLGIFFNSGLPAAEHRRQWAKLIYLRKLL